MRDAFGFTLDQFIYYGAYPGAGELIGDEDRWRDYVTGSIVDATINKDILVNEKNSVPKHQVYNNALKNIYCEKPFADAVQDRALWGRLFESAIGAHIMSYAYAGDYKVYYWRTKPGCEVDYVLEKKGRVIAIEVKSNSDPGNDGLSEFKVQYKPFLALVVGDGGMKAEDFLSINPADLFR